MICDGSGFVQRVHLRGEGELPKTTVMREPCTGCYRCDPGRAPDLDDEAEEFEEMESRPGGGGAGVVCMACIGAIVIGFFALGYMIGRIMGG